MASILLPTRQVEKQEAPKESALDKLLKGLQVAGSAFGIASDVSNLMTQSQARELATAREGREQSKFGIETQRTTMEAPEGQAGTPITLQTPAGDQVTSLRVPKPQEVDPTLAQKIKINDLAIKKAEKDLNEIEKGGVRSFDDINKFRKDYMTNDVTKDTNKVRSAYSRIAASAKDPSPAGDLAMIFNYMKMLDPGSVVRESEYATAQNAAGVPDRIRATYNRIIDGEKLATSQRLDFLSRAGDLWNAQVESQKIIDSQFKDFASKYDLNTQGIIPQDYTVNFGTRNDQYISNAGNSGFSVIPKAQAAQPFDPDSYIRGQ